MEVAVKSGDGGIPVAKGEAFNLRILLLSDLLTDGIRL